METKIGNRIKKWIAVAVVILFSAQNTLYAAPSLSFGTEASPKEYQTAPVSFEIPAEWGEVKSFYQAPKGTGWMIHIEDAHGSYEAQKNIQALLAYLVKTYGARLLFVEGADEELDPGLFRFFKEGSFNRKVADRLMRRGEFTGPEMFLLNSKRPEVRGYGMEETSLYRSDIELFRDILSKGQDLEVFFKNLEGEQFVLESRILSKELRELMKEWRAYSSNKIGLLSFFNFLAKEAAAHLELDLSLPVAQWEYPVLTRIHHLKEMESRLDLKQAQKEKKALLEFLKGKVSRELWEQVSRFELNASPLNVSDNPRFLFEKVYEACGGEVNFDHYPQLSSYIASLTFQAEMKSRELFEEMEKLTDKMFSALASSEKEQQLILIAKDMELSKKLFRLELSRQEYQALMERQDEFQPRRLAGRLEALLEKKESAGSIVFEEMEKNYKEALEFYRLAAEREDHFFEKTLSMMKKEKESRAILVTGGFHSEGMEKKIRDKGLSYALVSPRIRDIGESRGIYLRAMLGKSPAIEKSQIDNVKQLLPAESRKALGALSSSDAARDEALALVLKEMSLIPEEELDLLARLRAGERGLELPKEAGKRSSDQKAVSNVVTPAPAGGTAQSLGGWFDPMRWSPIDLGYRIAGWWKKLFAGSSNRKVRARYSRSWSPFIEVLEDRYALSSGNPLQYPADLRDPSGDVPALIGPVVAGEPMQVLMADQGAVQAQTAPAIPQSQSSVLSDSDPAYLGEFKRAYTDNGYTLLFYSRPAPHTVPANNLEGVTFYFAAIYDANGNFQGTAQYYTRQDQPTGAVPILHDGTEFHYEPRPGSTSGFLSAVIGGRRFNDHQVTKSGWQPFTDPYLSVTINRDQADRDILVAKTTDPAVPAGMREKTFNYPKNSIQGTSVVAGSVLVDLISGMEVLPNVEFSGNAARISLRGNEIYRVRDFEYRDYFFPGGSFSFEFADTLGYSLIQTRNETTLFTYIIHGPSQRIVNQYEQVAPPVGAKEVVNQLRNSSGSRSAEYFVSEEAGKNVFYILDHDTHQTRRHVLNGSPIATEKFYAARINLDGSVTFTLDATEQYRQFVIDPVTGQEAAPSALSEYDRARTDNGYKVLFYGSNVSTSSVFNPAVFDLYGRFVGAGSYHETVPFTETLTDFHYDSGRSELTATQNGRVIRIPIQRQAGTPFADQQMTVEIDRSQPDKDIVVVTSLIPMQSGNKVHKHIYPKDSVLAVYAVGGSSVVVSLVDRVEIIPNAQYNATGTGKRILPNAVLESVREYTGSQPTAESRRFFEINTKEEGVPYRYVLRDSFLVSREEIGKPSVPAGWDRVELNVNFAYRVVENVHPGKKTLEILNLQASFSYEAASIDASRSFSSVAVSEDGNYLSYTILNADGSVYGGSYQTILQKSAFIPAASNPNFSFATKVVNGFLFQLYLYSPETWHASLLASISIESYGDQAFRVRDVSPDGSFVAFSTAPSSAQVQSIQDPERKLIVPITYGLARIEWTRLDSGVPAVKLTALGGKVTIVDLETLTIVVPPALPAGFQHTPSNPDYAYRVTPYPGNPDYKRLELYDVKRETATVIGVIRKEFNFSEVDTVLSGAFASYKVSRQDGTFVSRHYYDIAESTLWEYARSNANFLFRAEVFGGHGIRLILRDLRNGTVQTLGQTSIESYGDQVFNVRDVSPNGEFVAFSTAPLSAQVQKIGHPSKKLKLRIEYGLSKVDWMTLPTGDPAVQFTSLGGKTTLVNLRTFKVIERPASIHLGSLIRVDIPFDEGQHPYRTIFRETRPGRLDGGILTMRNFLLDGSRSLYTINKRAGVISIVVRPTDHPGVLRFRYSEKDKDGGSYYRYQLGWLLREAETFRNLVKSQDLGKIDRIILTLRQLLHRSETRTIKTIATTNPIPQVQGPQEKSGPQSAEPSSQTKASTPAKALPGLDLKGIGLFLAHENQKTDSVLSQIPQQILRPVQILSHNFLPVLQFPDDTASRYPIYGGGGQVIRPTLEVEDSINGETLRIEYFFEQTANGLRHRIQARSADGSVRTVHEQPAREGERPFRRIEIRDNRVIAHPADENAKPLELQVPAREENAGRKDDPAAVLIAALISAGLVSPEFDREKQRQIPFLGGSSLGAEKTLREVAEEALSYSEAGDRANPMSILAVAEDVTMKIYNHDDLMMVTLYKNRMLSEGVSEEVSASDAVNVFNQGVLTPLILESLGITETKNRTPLILFTDDVLKLSKKKAAEPQAADFAKKLANAMTPGDLLVAVWEGKEKHPVIGKLYQEAKNFRVRDLNKDLLSNGRIQSLVKSLNAPAVSVSNLEETGDMELNLQGGAKVKLDVKLLLQHGVDIAEAVALIRQLADNPELRDEYFRKAGFVAKEGYWEMGTSFVALVERVYAEMAAQKRVAVAA